MSITLIIMKSPNAAAGRQIELADWLHLVARIPDLRLRTDAFTARNPDTSEVVSVPTLPGQTELQVGGNYVPFLGYRRGKLVMKFTDELNAPENPVRKKIADVSRQLGAIITHDAGDEILAW